MTNRVLLVATIVCSEDYLPTAAASSGFVGYVEEVSVVFEKAFSRPGCFDQFSNCNHAVGAIAAAWLVIEFSYPFSDQPFVEVLIFI
ncbi:MAG: hypothetical protein ACKN82_00600, partial [Pirellula sp.]